MTLVKIWSGSPAQSINLLHHRIRHRPPKAAVVAQHPLRLRPILPLSPNRPSPLRQNQTSCIIDPLNPRFGVTLWSPMRIVPSETGRKAAETLAGPRPAHDPEINHYQRLEFVKGTRAERLLS